MILTTYMASKEIMDFKDGMFDSGCKQDNGLNVVNVNDLFFFVVSLIY